MGAQPGLVAQGVQAVAYPFIAVPGDARGAGEGDIGLVLGPQAWESRGPPRVGEEPGAQAGEGSGLRVQAAPPGVPADRRSRTMNCGSFPDLR